MEHISHLLLLGQNLLIIFESIDVLHKVQLKQLDDTNIFETMQI